MKTLNASNTTLKIGDKFKRRNKKCGIELYEIIDIHTTWNFGGGKIKTEYLCTKEFLGQKIKEIYNANSIFMSIDNFKFYESANLIN